MNGSFLMFRLIAMAMSLYNAPIVCLMVDFLTALKSIVLINVH